MRRLQESCADELSFLSEIEADEVDLVVDDEENAELRYLPCYSGRHTGDGDDVEDDVQADASDSHSGLRYLHRMATNLKGFHEMLGLKQLGFKIVDIERGIEMYETSEMSNRDLKRYGLKESSYDLYKGKLKVAGKKALYIHDDAVQSITGGAAVNYIDMWRSGGAVEKQIKLAKSEELAAARRHLEQSLSIRKRQSHGKAPDMSHKAMIDGLLHCIATISRVANELEDDMNKKLDNKKNKVG